MFATLLASGSVLLYGKYVDKQLNSEVVALNTEINSFSEAGMQEVLEFDKRLGQAYGRLNNSVSIVSMFDALEDATIDTVRIASLDLTREKDEKFVLDVSVETDSFDSTIFQRGVYQNNKVIDSVEISAVQSAKVEDKSGTSVSSGTPLIMFRAQIEIPLSSVPYVENSNQVKPITIVPPKIEQKTTSTEGSEADVVSNEENI